MFQGHPEYDAISLLKEYKREVNHFLAGINTEYPPFPENYFTPLCQAILDEFRDRVMQAKVHGKPEPIFPERLIRDSLDNTWHDSAEAVINNWIGLVYQLTHVDRRKPFRDDVDPEHPLASINTRN
jgi:homoserine O-succinyltransferase